MDDFIKTGILPPNVPARNRLCPFEELSTTEEFSHGSSPKNLITPSTAF